MFMFMKGIHWYMYIRLISIGKAGSGVEHNILHVCEIILITKDGGVQPPDDNWVNFLGRR